MESKKDLDTLKVEYTKEKASIAASITAAQKKEVESLKAIHALNKANIERELETTKAVLAKVENDLLDARKELDSRTKQHLKFLQEQTLNQTQA